MADKASKTDKVKRHRRTPDEIAWDNYAYAKAKQDKEQERIDFYSSKLAERQEIHKTLVAETEWLAGHPAVKARLSSEQQG